MGLKTGFQRFCRLRLGLSRKKSKKAQLSLGLPVVIILVVVFSGALIFFVMGRLADINLLVKEKELGNFVTSLNNVLKKQSAESYDNADLVTLSLPEDISSVCFADGSKEIDRFAKRGLASRVMVDKTQNLFLSPIEDNPSFRLNNIEVGEINPLCVKTRQGKISLKLTNKGKNALVEAKDAFDKDVDCVSVVYNGEPEEKIDVVFLNYGYTKEEEFAKDVNDYVNSFFLNIEPFKAKGNNFNFFRVYREGSLGCTIKKAGILQYFISCDSFSVKNAASECPNDYIFILTDRGKIEDFVEPVRSSAFSNIAKINTADEKFVLVHEFGHTFSDLDDEYVDEGYYGGEDFSDSINCKASCGGFDGVDGIECEEGCSVGKLYRSSKDSIMRDYYKSKEFMVWNTKVIEEKIGEYED
ncbi:MAG: M64 family metallopeptidase [Candidatus Woesearchaeota archaeon]|jgi:hypothetical protein|nr:M64 family metallopeptidase [Candidatus Woesearchaeota archaeon]|tara:strand:- start:362 stop:1600 length:1239 start_codon:yes stop_codon:yes gene_type:complete